MRKIKLSTGKEILVSPLKARDVRELTAMPKEDDGFAQMFETLKRAGFKDDAIDEMYFPDVMAINKAIIAETYGLPEEVKNS